MKYIIFKHFNEEVPILFPSTIQHSAMAKSVSSLSLKPVAAGFLKPDPFGNVVACYGGSMTLNVKSRGYKDSQIINNFLGLD